VLQQCLERLARLPVHPQCQRLFLLPGEGPPDAVFAAQPLDAQQSRQHRVPPDPGDVRIAPLNTLSKIVPRTSA
jgi:hypothetical protein